MKRGPTYNRHLYSIGRPLCLFLFLITIIKVSARGQIGILRKEIYSSRRHKIVILFRQPKWAKKQHLAYSEASVALRRLGSQSLPGPGCPWPDQLGVLLLPAV